LSAKGANNLGITALDVRANPEDARQRAVYVSIANFSSNNVQTEASYLLDKSFVGNPSAQNPGRGRFASGFQSLHKRALRIFTLRLTFKDDLAADNQASIVSLLPKPVKILLVSRGNRLLEKAFRAVSQCPPRPRPRDLTDPATSFDFVVPRRS